MRHRERNRENTKGSREKAAGDGDKRKNRGGNLRSPWGKTVVTLYGVSMSCDAWEDVAEGIDSAVDFLRIHRRLRSLNDLTQILEAAERRARTVPYDGANTDVIFIGGVIELLSPLVNGPQPVALDAYSVDGIVRHIHEAIEDVFNEFADQEMGRSHA